MVSSVSSMGGNVRDGIVKDDKVISTAMEAGSSDTGDSKDVVCKGGDVGDNGGMTCKSAGVWKVMCKSVGLWKLMCKYVGV